MENEQVKNSGTELPEGETESLEQKTEIPAQELESARAVMDKARREIEADALRARIPAGAPQRMAPDMSGLSAREKIQYGLGG